MKKYEYKIIEMRGIDAEHLANDLGFEGWELMFCVEGTLFFKREIEL